MKLQAVLVGLGLLHIVIGFGSEQSPGNGSKSGASSFPEDTDHHTRVCFQMLEQLEIRQRLPGS